MNKKSTEKGVQSSKLRACLNCAIILKTDEFKTKGCPNCPFLYTQKGTNMNLVTSSQFKGCIGLMDPKNSWVGKWHRIGTYIPGLYAMIVEGELSDNHISMIEREGRIYVPRHNSFELE